MIENIILFDKSISLYYLFWLFGLISALIMGWTLRKNYDFSFSRATLFTVLEIVLGYLAIWVMSWISGGGKANEFILARIVPIAWFYFAIIACLFNERIWKVSDFLAPVFAIIYGISHLGCIFVGCCHGYPAQWGLYSNVAQTICFPIQLIECIINIFIALILCWMTKKKKQQQKLWAWYMIMFGVTRFITEFFRDNKKLWHGLSEFALYALASLILGVVALMVIKKTSKEASRK